jgi:hypothetical protein
MLYCTANYPRLIKPEKLAYQLATPWQDGNSWGRVKKKKKRSLKFC